MSNPLRLYLAHNLNDRHEIRKIELELEKEFDIELLNPFYDVKREDIEEMDTGKITRWEFTLQQCREIVNRDLSGIDSCDGLLAIIKTPSIGTTLEIAYAFQHKKVIHIVSENFHSHPWLRVYADQRFVTIDDYKKYLKLLLVNVK